MEGRTPEIVIALILALLVGGALAFGGGEEKEKKPSGTAQVAKRVAPIARRVEAIREIRFRRRPVPVELDGKQVRSEGLAEADKRYPASRRLADEETLKLLGLIAPSADVRSIQGSVLEDEVAGFYDTRRKRLAIVRDAAGTDPVLAEIILSHELVHALEDERFGLEEPTDLADDGASAYGALVEGTATAVMDEYAKRHISPGQSLGSAIGALGAASSGAELPPYVRRAFEFSYFGGRRFVEALYGAAKGWRLVNFALARRPPVSTEQIMHPEKYLRDERPEPVKLDFARSLGAGWRRIGDGSVGEFDTAELLRLAQPVAGARTAAEGWAAGRFELWRRGPLPARDCAAPCRARDALVLVWRWDTRRDASEFAAAARRYLQRGLRGAAGRGAFAFRTRERATALAMAPTRDLAARLVATSLER